MQGKSLKVLLIPRLLDPWFKALKNNTAVAGELVMILKNVLPYPFLILPYYSISF